MSMAAIRRAGPGDEAALSLVGGATFLETFAGLVDGADIIAHSARQHAATVYAGWLAAPDYSIFLAAIAPGGAPVGYCVLCPPADMPSDIPRPGDLEIKRIYLLSRFHGSGAGRGLMGAAMDEARTRGAARVLIGVKDDNARAIAFYKKCGFDVVGTRSFNVGAGTYSDLIFGKMI